MANLIPPEEITQLMQWLAEKAKNATSPMNVRELCRQFKEETGSSVAVNAIEKRIEKSRLKIHEMDEFDMETKVKKMFALSAPIDVGFLIELKKVADVEVDDKPRIIHYKQKDGGLELNAKNWTLSMKETEQRSMMQFLAEKTKTVDFPMNDRAFLRDFKENNGCHDAIWCLDNRYTRVKKAIFEFSEFDKSTKVKMMFISHTKLSDSILEEAFLRDFKENDGCHDAIWCLVKRYERVKKTIFNSFEFDKNTKVKMMFISNAILTDDILEELQKDAIVELDEKQRIKKYRSNDGSLELQGDHSMSTRVKTAIAVMQKKRKKRTRVVVNSSDSEKDERNRKRRGRTFDQASTSLPTKSSERIKRNKARSSSSEESEDVPSDQEDDDEKSMTRKDDSSKVSDVDNSSGDDMDYDAPIYNTEDLEHAPTEPKSQKHTETPEVTGEEEEGAEPSSSVKIETMSLLEFLTHLRSPIAQYTPTLASKIDEKIEKLEEKDQQISFHLIIASLEMCIQILNTPDEMDSDEATTSLSDFFYRLERAMRNITHSMMNDLYLKIENLAWAEDTKVSLEHIRSAMQKALDKIFS